MNFRNTFLVMRQEIFATLRRWGFVIFAFVLPILLGVIAIVIAAFNNRPGADPGEEEVADTTGLQGFVDPAGWIRELPQAGPAAIYIEYPDEGAALDALEGEEIDGYFVIAEDYVDSGDLTYVSLDFDPIGGSVNTRPFEALLTANLLAAVPDITLQVLDPMDITVSQIAPDEPSDGEANWLAEQLPLILVILLYMVILMPAGILVNSITDEKKNRVLEVLISSISPSQFFAGKLLALGLLGMLQTLVWIGTIWGVGRFGGRPLNLPPGLELPTHLFVWALVFSITGFAMYGTQMAGIGALAPNVNDSRSLTMLVLAPLIAGYFFNVIFLEVPEAPVMVVLSLFPLTGPVVMVGRMAATDIPVWQPILSLILQIAAVVGIFQLFSRLFRAQALLSGQPLTVRGLVRALRSG
jgi:ABC-2 type transport system permease protein